MCCKDVLNNMLIKKLTINMLINNAFSIFMSIFLVSLYASLYAFITVWQLIIKWNRGQTSTQDKKKLRDFPSVRHLKPKIIKRQCAIFNE